MRVYQWQGEALHVLDQVPENSQSFRVLTSFYLAEAANFAGRKKFVFLADQNFQLLFTNVGRLRPVIIRLVHDRRVAENANQLVNDNLVHIH